MPRAAGEVPESVLRLALCPEAGPAFQQAALARFGSWEGVLAAEPEDLAGLGRAGPDAACRIHAGLRSVDPGAERRAMERCGARAVVLGDPDYPVLLAPLPLPPVLLWVRGDVGAFRTDSVAVVGARRATPYGLTQAARFAGALASDGFVVVSGGARGVDAAAHRAALRAGGTTVAVLGGGLAEPYPPEHASLFESIVDAGGLLVSEFPMHWPPLAANFPRRNRIISGISLTVLVVEAGMASGALVTARHAIDDHLREPCAVPGPVDSARSAGCNAAIRDGWVHVATCPEDVMAVLAAGAERLDPSLDGAAAAEADRIPGHLRPAAERAAALIRRRPRIRTEELAASLGIPEHEAASARTFAEVLLAVSSSRSRRRSSRRTGRSG